MHMDASTLTWHDAVVAAVHVHDRARRMVWEVEVFRWDLAPQGDAQAGRLTFEDVGSVEARHDLANVPTAAQVDWEVLAAHFEREEGQTRCQFLLTLPRVVREGGGFGYAELVISCRQVRFAPSIQNAPGAKAR